MKEIAIDLPDANTMRLWRAVADLVDRLPRNWVLIGGLMVQLHALEHGATDVRLTGDIDVLGQARPQGALSSIDEALRSDGFALAGPDRDGYAFRYERDELIVDVLAPDRDQLASGPWWRTQGNRRARRVWKPSAAPRQSA